MIQNFSFSQLFGAVILILSVSGQSSLSSLHKESTPAIHIEDTTFSMFSGGADGQCGHVEEVRAYCTDSLCVIWQKSDTYPYPSRHKMAKTLRILERYIELGTRVMNYQPTLQNLPHKIFRGKDGKSRTWTIEMADYLCGNYGGASYNGVAWNALPKEPMLALINSVDAAHPFMPQVALYEMGRSMYDLRLDNILDWQMEEPSKYGFWTLGFNGALTVLAPENLGLRLKYQGTSNDLGLFRKNRINDINGYINNRQWNFDNAWSVWLLPWSPHQSINDMMSGLVIALSDKFGGIPFLTELVKQLLEQPATANRTDRQERAKNLFNAAKLAAKKINGNDRAITKYFKETLRWTFLSNS